MFINFTGIIGHTFPLLVTGLNLLQVFSAWCLRGRPPHYSGFLPPSDNMQRLCVVRRYESEALSLCQSCDKLCRVYLRDFGVDPSCHWLKLSMTGGVHPKVPETWVKMSMLCMMWIQWISDQYELVLVTCFLRHMWTQVCSDALTLLLEIRRNKLTNISWGLFRKHFDHNWHHLTWSLKWKGARMGVLRAPQPDLS